MLDFLNIFTNPWILIIVLAPIVMMVGIVLGNYISQPRRNLVLKLDPESHRGVQLEVQDEDSVSVYCNPVGNMPPQRFIKRLNPFHILQKGWMRLQQYSMWFGRYGTAYVHEFLNENVNLHIADVVFHYFGEKQYKMIPPEVREKIESGQVGVMVEFPNSALTPLKKDGKPMPSVSEDDVNRDADERAMRNLWASYEKEQKKSVLNMAFAVGCGVAIGIILCLLFKWGAPIQVVNEVVTP